MKLKICVVGPKGTGKTAISNFLCGQIDHLDPSNNTPTAGVRILEFDASVPHAQDPINIELWDASGDSSFEGCWKAIMHESDGVVLIYNPDAPGQDQQIGDWFDFFVRKNNMKDEQCIVFAHRQNEGSDKFRPPPLFQKLRSALTNPSSGADIKSIFANFVNELYNIKRRL